MVRIKRMMPRLRDGLLSCRLCEKYKLPSEFHRNRARPNGRQSYCRVCIGAYQRDYQKQYYLAHREQLLPKHRISSELSRGRKREVQNAIILPRPRQGNDYL